MKLKHAMAGLTALCAAAAWDTPSSQAGEFDGVTINVMTFTGPQIAEPLQRRGKEFGEKTGATVNVIIVPFSDLYSKLLTDWATGTNSIDAAIFAPPWMADYVAGGYLEDLTPRAQADASIKWDDIAPFFRDYSQTWGGKVYMLTLDGDFHMVYYRTDLFAEAGLSPPETWDDYIAAAKALNGKDMNGDGDPDYGSCIFKKRNAQSFWTIWSLAGGFIQSMGTSQGLFFNTDDMAPMVNNEGFAAALDILKETTQYGPPNEINMDVGDTRSLFVAGRCALALDWGDIGTLAIDPAQSKVMDKTGAVMLPGSKKVVDRATGKLVDCTPEICPHAVNGVNHTPFAAFGGWGGGINAAADPKVKDAAYALFAYMSAPEQSNIDVTIGPTGFNPYRLSQFENLDLWVKAGMSEKAANDYLGAIKASLNNPNMALDLNIAKNAEYMQVILDTAIARYLAGEIDKEQTMQTVEEGWNELSDDIGREEQLAQYRAKLGLQ